MRNLLCLLAILFLLQSCHSRVNDNYFSFDRIDYYHIDISDEEADRQLEYPDTSEAIAMKSDILLEHVPVTINDTIFIAHMPEMGFKKWPVDTIFFASIKDIFQVKNTENTLTTSCIYIYRDILIFRKQGKITGIAKICFDCLANHIVGTPKNTASFGQNGGYGALEKLLKKIRR